MHSASYCAVVLVAAAATTAGCVVAGPSRGDVEAEPGAVAFDLTGPGGAALTVPVTINGKGPYPFVLDTGATVTCVDESLVADLSLPDAGGPVAFGGTVTGLGRMRLVSLESVTVGDATVRDLQGCAVDLAPMRQAGVEVQGLLGLNFLREYRLTVDFPSGMVRLEPPRAEVETR